MDVRVPASEALAISRANKGSKWPSRPDSARLEPICSPISKPGFKLDAGESIFTIGSCFARNIEAYLRLKGFEVPCQEFTVPTEELWTGTVQVPGVLNKYTPHSMLNEVRFAFGTTDGSEFLVEDKAGWFDTQLHTNVATSYARALERRQQVRELYADAIRKSRIVIITLGLIETWFDAQNGTYLNETPHPHMLRTHPDRFFFEVMTVDTARAVTFELIEALKANGREDQKVMLTVSPIPLARTFTGDDVILANTYSKSVLRVVAQEAANRFDWIDYFGSYESVMLSDRNIAWQDDLIHAQNQVVSANISRMLASYA